MRKTTKRGGRGSSSSTTAARPSTSGAARARAAREVDLLPETTAASRRRATAGSRSPPRRRRRPAQLRRRRRAPAGSSRSSTAAYASGDVGIVGPKLLYPDRRIQSAGSYRNLGAPEWFDHRYRFKAATHPQANVVAPVLGVTGACMYVKREVLDALGASTRRYGMAFEDVDYCLRAWEAGLAAPTTPARDAAAPRVQDPPDRARRARAGVPALLLGALGPWFDERDVRTAGRPAAHRLRDRGHRRRRRPPRHLRAPQRARRARPRRRAVVARRRARLVRRSTCRCARSRTTTTSPPRSRKLDAIKVATWWNTAARSGWPRCGAASPSTSSRTSRRPTTRARDDAGARARRATGTEFRYLTISGWNRDRLRELGLDARRWSRPASTSTPSGRCPTSQRRDDMLLALGRTQPAQEPPAHRRRLAALGERRPELCLFGIEPELGPSDGARYVERPERRGRQRALQPGHGVRADLDARGLLPAAARGDGDRRRRRVHRRPRQPRLLPRRRELPDARADAGAVSGGDRRRARRPRAARAARRGGHRDGGGVRLGAADRRARGATSSAAPQRSSAIRGASRLNVPEPEREHARRRSRAGSAAASAPDRLGGARGVGVDQRVADLLDDHRERVES